MCTMPIRQLWVLFWTVFKNVQSRKTIAVLGDMLELGPDSAAMHQAMAQHLAPDAIEKSFYMVLKWLI